MTNPEIETCQMYSQEADFFGWRLQRAEIAFARLVLLEHAMAKTKRLVDWLVVSSHNWKNMKKYCCQLFMYSNPKKDENV